MGSASRSIRSSWLSKLPCSYLTRVLTASVTALSPPDAEKRVDTVISQARDNIRQTADYREKNREFGIIRPPDAFFRLPKTTKASRVEKTRYMVEVKRHPTTIFDFRNQISTSQSHSPCWWYVHPTRSEIIINAGYNIRDFSNTILMSAKISSIVEHAADVPKQAPAGLPAGAGNFRANSLSVISKHHYRWRKNQRKQSNQDTKGHRKTQRWQRLPGDPPGFD